MPCKLLILAFIALLAGCGSAGVKNIEIKSTRVLCPATPAEPTCIMERPDTLDELMRIYLLCQAEVYYWREARSACD